MADVGGQKFDVIIDDGSHIPWHQIFTLETIFDTFLKDGGVYIIEDIETSYWWGDAGSTDETRVETLESTLKCALETKI